MKKIIYTLILSAAFTLQAQQDVHFSQFFNAPVLINPAQSGLFSGDVRGIVNYRNQWGSITTPFVTMNAAVDMPILKKIENGKFGVGLNFTKDNAGESNYTQTNYGLSLAYHLALDNSNKNYLSIGFNGGMIQRSVVMDAFYWGNQWTGADFNTALPSYENTSSVASSAFDMNVGLNWLYMPNNYTLYNAGLALNHVTSPNFGYFSSSPLYKRWTIYGKGEWGSATSNAAFVANGIFMKQGPNGYFNIGGELKYKLQEASHYTDFRNEAYFAIGAYMRIGDAIYPVAQFQMSGFKVGLSYDFNVSKLSKASNGMGGLEVMMGYVADLLKGKTRQARFK